MKSSTVFFSAIILSIATGCASGGSNPSGQQAVYLDPSQRGPVSGIGIEQQDIASMSDLMMRDILTVPQLASAVPIPRIIVDSQYFDNEGLQRINVKLLANKLRVGLQRASGGRMIFVGRERANMVAEERELKRSGVTDVGTTGLTRAQAGADYRLAGTIADTTARDSQGMTQRYTQITYEIIDLELGTIVWSNQYELSKAAADDVVYR